MSATNQVRRVKRQHLALFLLLLALPSSAQTQRPRVDGTINTNRAAAVVFQDMADYPQLLQRVQLVPEDERLAASTIVDFVRQFREYGNAVDKGVLTSGDFFTLRDLLLDKMRLQLQKQLTPNGWKKFDAFLKSEFLHQLPFSRTTPNLIETQSRLANK